MRTGNCRPSNTYGDKSASGCGAAFGDDLLPRLAIPTYPKASPLGFSPQLSFILRIKSCVALGEHLHLVSGRLRLGLCGCRCPPSARHPGRRPGSPGDRHPHKPSFPGAARNPPPGIGRGAGLCNGSPGHYGGRARPGRSPRTLQAAGPGPGPPRRGRPRGLTPGDYNSRQIPAPPPSAHTPFGSLAEAAHQSEGDAGPGQPMGRLLLTRRSYF